MVKFHETLSPETVYMRYFSPLKLQQRVAHTRLSKICFIDYDREMVLVATQRNPETHETEIMAAGRLTKLHGRNEGEYGLLVGDPFQGHGLGTEILDRLIGIGRAEGLSRIVGYILPDNVVMRNICESLGFKLNHNEAGGNIKAVLDL
jgi:acetyltransferase